MIDHLVAILSAVFYAAASARLYHALTTASRVSASSSPALDDAPADPNASRDLTRLLVVVAVLLHAWVAVRLTGLPTALNLPFFTALAVTALTVVTLQLALCLRQPADYLGLAIYPLAAVALLSSQIDLGASTTLDLSIKIHVLLSVIAYSLLALAACQAVLVSVQRRYLNRHKPGGFIRALPAYDQTESLLFSLLAAGFVMLTLSLISGFFYLEDMFAQHLVHKTLLSCAGWLIFGVLLFGRWRFGWRGRRVVQWALGGFALLILAYFGSKLVLELILARS